MNTLSSDLIEESREVYRRYPRGVAVDLGGGDVPSLSKVIVVVGGTPAIFDCRLDLVSAITPVVRGHVDARARLQFKVMSIQVSHGSW